MAIDIKAVFNDLQTVVNNFVTDSQIWRDQIVLDKPKYPIDAASEDKLHQLAVVENNLSQDVKNPPATLNDLQSLFVVIEGRVTQTRDLCTIVFFGVSKSLDALVKDSNARNSLIKLITFLDTKIPDILDLNLFLSTMLSLIGTSGVDSDDFDLTKRLFERKQLNSGERVKFHLNDGEDKIFAKLIKSWEIVITKFVEMNKVHPGLKDPVQIDTNRAIVQARFFTMHGLLELLYDQLEANRRTTDILSSAI